MSSEMDSEVTVMDETSSNYLVKYPDGTVDNVSRSPHNRLLFEHNLWGLLKSRDTVWRGEDDDYEVEIRPAEEYFTLSLNGNDVKIGDEQKTELVDALSDVYENPYKDGMEAMVELYDEISEGRVRQRIINRFANGELFDSIELKPRGWLFHDHVLLTYDAKAIHPGTTSRKRSGSLIEENSSTDAYDLHIEAGEARETRFPDGNKVRLTATEMEFLAKAMWLKEHAPRLRGESDE